jgi:V/A-type H+-transporting ATPase subunit I
MAPVVEKLHELRLLHIVNYNSSMPEFELGKPLGKGKEFSEDLIKLRSMARYLEIKSKAPEVTYPESQVVSQMDDLLNNVGAEVNSTFERITEIETEVKSKQDQIKVLRPLAACHCLWKRIMVMIRWLFLWGPLPLQLMQMLPRSLQ